MVDTYKPSKNYVFVIRENDYTLQIPTLDLSHIRKCHVTRLHYKSSGDTASLLTLSLGAGYDQTWVIGQSMGPSMCFAVYPMIAKDGRSQLVYTANGSNDQWDAVFGSYQSLQQLRFHVEEDSVVVSNLHLENNPLFIELRFE